MRLIYLASGTYYFISSEIISYAKCFDKEVYFGQTNSDIPSWFIVYILYPTALYHNLCSTANVFLVQYGKYGKYSTPLPLALPHKILYSTYVPYCPKQWPGNLFLSNDFSPRALNEACIYQQKIHVVLIICDVSSEF